MPCGSVAACFPPAPVPSIGNAAPIDQSSCLTVAMQYKPHAKSAKGAKKGTKRCFSAQDFLNCSVRKIGSCSFKLLCGLRDLCVRPPSTATALLRLRSKLNKPQINRLPAGGVFRTNINYLLARVREFQLAKVNDLKRTPIATGREPRSHLVCAR